MAAIKDQYKWRYIPLINCVYGFECLERLVEALWILHQNGVQCSKKDKSIRCGKVSDESPLGINWSSTVLYYLRDQYGKFEDFHFFTNELSRGEERNPYLVINDFFKATELRVIREELSLWRNTALTNPWDYEAMDKAKVAALYMKVNKLLEAAFVINEIYLLKEGISNHKI